MARLSTLRAAWWTLRSARRVRRRVERDGVRAAPAPPPPRLPAGAGRGVSVVLWLGSYSCLVQALVRQAWELSQGQPRDLVIGVTAPGRDFSAHAWLEGDRPAVDARYTELVRFGAALSRPAR